MPRPRRYRRISRLPRISGFKPIGRGKNSISPIQLLYEEFEAIRLSDYKNLSQEEAAKEMEVSRPTFTRIINSARKKIAKAFTEGKSIIIEGGNVYSDTEWLKCENCDEIFCDDNRKECPECHSTNITHMNRTQKFCICPQCGNKVQHKLGHPCRKTICNKCGSTMMRE